MNNMALVGVADAFANLDYNVELFFERQGSSATDECLETHPFEKLHYQIRATILHA